MHTNTQLSINVTFSHKQHESFIKTESLELFFVNNFTNSEDEISKVVKYYRTIKATKDEMLIENGKILS